MNHKDLFRKKSLEHLSNPDQLNDYIKISSPAIWLLLTAIIIVLVGSIVWGVFGVLAIETADGVQYIAPIRYLMN